MARQQTQRWWLDEEARAPQTLTPVPQQKSGDVDVALAPAERDLWDDLEAEARKQEAGVALDSPEVLEFTVKPTQWRRRITAFIVLNGYCTLLSLWNIVRVWTGHTAMICVLLLAPIWISSVCFRFARWRGPALRIAPQGLTVRLPLHREILIRWDDIRDVRMPSRYGMGSTIEIALSTSAPEQLRKAVRRSLPHILQADVFHRNSSLTVCLDEFYLGKPTDVVLASITEYRSIHGART
jgi:hypothetical protein